MDQQYWLAFYDCAELHFTEPFIMIRGKLKIHGGGTRALEILKSESVQPMTSSMSPFPKKKKNMYISPVTKTNDNWQSYNSF